MACFVSAHKRNQNRRVVSIATDHLALNRENECTGPWASRFPELIFLCSKAQICCFSSPYVASYQWIADEAMATSRYWRQQRWAKRR